MDLPRMEQELIGRISKSWKSSACSEPLKEMFVLDLKHADVNYLPGWFEVDVARKILPFGPTDV